ncbi:MAG: TauD/TfdA family dioxygenase [Alphaproteobacteria bacterium]|nr:TauD/TfdA family dioxygenase [Alphaproteobacteria bacterium]
MKITTLNDLAIPLVLKAETKEEKKILNLSLFCRENKQFIFDKLHTHGALLFRGFDIKNTSEFDSVATNLGISLLNYKGGDSPRDKINKDIYTSTHYPPHLSISLHNELSFSSFYPGYLLFYCKVPPIEGGETPIASGRSILSDLSNDLIKSFKDKKIKYIMNLHNGYGAGKSWKECFETDNVNEVERILTQKKANYSWSNNYSSLKIEEVVCPIIHHPVTGEEVFFAQADQWHPSNLDKETYHALKEFMNEDDFYHNCKFGDDLEIPNKYLEEIREKVSIHKISFPWEENDLMLIDNILTLHGRNPFKGDRKVYVCMGNV